MPFSGGVFTLAEPAFQPNTTIASSAVNSDLSDIADGLTAVICKDGTSTPTAAIPLHANGVTYSVDPDTGLHRTAANTEALFCGGTDIISATTTGASVTGDLAVSGNITQGGFASGAIVGEIRAYALTTAPAGWHLCDGTALTATSPLRTALLAASSPYGTSGSDPLLPDLRGRAPFGKDTTTTRITVAGGNFDGNVLGGSQARQTLSLTVAQANLPNVNLTSNAQNVTVVLNGQSFNISPSGNNVGQALAGSVGGGTISSFTYAVGGQTVPLGGSGTAITSGAIPNALIVNFIIYVGA